MRTTRLSEAQLDAAVRALIRATVKRLRGMTQ
jgi:hypothetical protein